MPLLQPQQRGSHHLADRPHIDGAVRVSTNMSIDGTGVEARSAANAVQRTPEISASENFAAAVIDRLGKTPRIMTPVYYPETAPALPVRPPASITRPCPVEKRLVGVDVFLHWDESGRNPAVLGQRLEAVAGPDFGLSLITNRGVKVYPAGNRHTLCTDHWRCRFPMTDAGADPRAIAALLVRLAEAGLDAVKTENLYEFDRVRGYSQAQGE